MCILYTIFYNRALGMFCRAIKLDPDMCEAWYNIGKIQYIIYNIQDTISVNMCVYIRYYVFTP